MHASQPLLGVCATFSGNSPTTERHHPKFPINTADIASHVLWKNEDRADVVDCIPKLIDNVEDGCAQSRNDTVNLSDTWDIHVRSIFALTSIAYNTRLREKICSRPGFLSLVANHAVHVEELSMASAHMGLLYRLTFRAGASPIPSPHLEQLLDWLVNYTTSVASTAAVPEGSCRAGKTKGGTALETMPSMCLGVLANLTRSCHAAQCHVKAQVNAPDLYKALTQLLAKPGHTIMIVFALQTLANLVLHDDVLGATLFGESNLHLIFEIVFSLVREVDQGEQALHALRAASNLLNDLFMSPRVLQHAVSLCRENCAELENLLDAIAALQHSLDPVLPLLELACSLLRPPSLRSKLQCALHSPRAERAGAFPALFTLVACPHVDVAVAAANLVIALCRAGFDDFGKGVSSTTRLRAISEMAEASGIGGEICAVCRHPSLCRHAISRVLTELSQAALFSKDIRAQISTAHVIRQAKAALQEQDGPLALSMLLLGFQCWESMPLMERRELLLLGRSQPVVDAWSATMAFSKDSTEIHECLLAAYHLLAVNGAEEAHLAASASVNVCSTKLPAWIEFQTLVESLAAAHSARDNELEHMRLQVGRANGELMKEKEKTWQLEASHAAEWRQEANAHEEERRRQSRELHASAGELVEAWKRGDEAINSASRDAENLVHARSKLEAAERRIEDAEIMHADILQRALQAENLCRQLNTKVQEKETELKRASEDREGLLREVERRQQDLLSAQQLEQELAVTKETLERLEAECAQHCTEKLNLQRSNSVLMETRERLEADLRGAWANAQDQAAESQRREALLDARAEDMGRRLTSSDTASRAVEKERDEALREARWLRCELAALQRLEHDRGQRLLHQDPEVQAGRQALSIVEQRLRERAKQAHNDALDLRA